MAKCDVCFRHCEIKERGTGFCGARAVKDGVVFAQNYGKITSMGLDPIEKKPLARFYPGSLILSVGSYGCNLRCPFCQNSEISWSDEVSEWRDNSREITPEELVAIAVQTKGRGNIGIAYTYNEPLIGYEFVLDCAKLAHEAGLKNVIVTNGTAELSVLEKLTPYIDAMNIDLKGFSKDYCNTIIGGNLAMNLAFIKEAVKHCHVELTTLVVPGENDSESIFREQCEWISSLKNEKGDVIGKDIPLHISRFFPHFHMMDKQPTNVGLIYHFAEVARADLKYVYTGNC